MNDFISAVKAMRSAQKSYFKTRNGHYLMEAKRLELLVDDMIKEMTE